jgi:hypothetical protein
VKVSAILVARTLVVVALFPALAGCATSGGEPLQSGDIEAGDAPLAGITPDWADLELALVRPGMMISTEARDCLANFLFIRPDNGAVFIGTTAYCVRDMPIGTPAIVGEATDIAVLVYSSAQTMSELGETDADALEYNDLALFHLDTTTIRKANPTLPSIGGPRDLSDGAAHDAGTRLRAFARMQELPRETDWREGIVSGQAGDWALLTYSSIPVAPGFTGGAVVDEAGDAVGIVVTLGVVPNPGANAVARLDTMLDYAREQGRMPIELATSAPGPQAR